MARLRLLIVEDNPADRDLVVEYLEEDTDRYEVVTATRLADAVALIERAFPDLVILDLGLSDATGLVAITKLRSILDETPIVVLTGDEDEEVAFACISAGADDFVMKRALTPTSLRRAIGYSLSRGLEQRQRALARSMAEYRTLASAGSTTRVASRMAGMAPVAERAPEQFAAIAERYARILRDYLQHLGVKHKKPRPQMELVVTDLGDLGAGPRDLVDLHLVAMESVVSGLPPGRAKSYAVEGRLFALEMMGHLLDYYRLGTRRRSLLEPTT